MTGPKEPKATTREGGRWRAYAGAIVVMAVVFGGSAAIGAHVRSTKETEVKVPTGAAGKDGLGVLVKPAVPVTLTVYEDLRSPASKAFAEQYAATFEQLLATGQVEIDYRLVTQSDTDNGGRGALAAANAAACAQDQGRFQEYVQQLWAVQPTDPQEDALGSEKLLKELGAQAGDIEEASFAPCVQSGDHDGWVRASQEAFAAAGFTQVPVVQVNGETVADPTPAGLRGLVKQAAAEVEAATAEVEAATAAE